MSHYAKRNPENPFGLPAERHEPKESERAMHAQTYCEHDRPTEIGCPACSEARAEALLEKMDADNRQRRIYAENGDALVAALRAIAGETCDHGAGNLCPRDTAVFALQKLEEAK